MRNVIVRGCFGSMVGSLLCTAAVVITPAFAQTGNQVGGLEEITVTARRTNESLLDVPVTVAVMTSEAMETRNITDLYGIAEYTPGLKLNGTLNSRNDRSQQSMIIRGMTPTFGGNVSVFIDGAPIIGSGFAEGIEDLARVEVIKGPQSATFGRSVFAGAINLVTKDPSATDYHGSVSAEVMTHDGHDIHGGIEGPIIRDKLAFRFNARNFRTDGTYVNQALPSERFGAQATDSYTLALRATPADNLSVKWFGSYYTIGDGPGGPFKSTSADFNCAAGSTGAALNYRCGEIPKFSLSRLAANDQIDVPVRNVILYNSTGRLYWPEGIPSTFTDHAGLERHVVHTHGIISYDIAPLDATFSSTTSYDDAKSVILFNVGSEDMSNVPNPNYNASTVASLQPFRGYMLYSPSHAWGWSQDVRLQGGAQSRIHWTIGGSYYRQSTSGSLGSLQQTGPVVSGTPNLSTTKTKGVYASLGYDILPNLTISVEGRYQNDKISAFSYIVPTTFTPYVTPAVAFNPLITISQNTFKPRALIQWHPTEDVMVYASYAEGGNPGGFNANLIQYNASQQQMLKDFYGVQLEILPEKIKSWELGVKGTFLDNRAQITADVYHAQWINQVISSQIAITNIPGILPTSLFTLSTNGGQTNFSGVEVEGTFRVTEELTVNGSFAYNPSTIKKYICTICRLQVTGSNDVTGKHLPAVAATTGSLGAQYTRALTDDIDGYLRVDWNYQGKIWEDETNLAWIPASSKTAVRVGVTRGNLTAEGYVTNLFDDTSWSGVQRSTDVFRPGVNDIILGLPKRRTFGLRVRASM